MAVTTLGRSSRGRLSKTDGILLDTFEYVAPKKQLPVPNRLLDCKIFSKISQNGVVKASPSVLHFGGFELGKTHSQLLELGNASSDVQRLHIIPPQSKYFSIKYTKGDRLVPGLALECTVEFTPDEWRYYYDCIRVHTKGEDNLIIPIHAYPVISTSDFPEYISFPPVPVGYKKSKVIPLRCYAPIDFEFQLSYLQPHPSFVVDPMMGTIPANGEVEIVVTFSPSDFITAHMKLQMVISQFNSKPLICSVTGNSVPGLAKKLIEESFEEQASNVFDPSSISNLERARRKKKLKKIAGPSEPTPAELERDGIKFPVNLDNPYAVAQVLNQQPGKLRAKDLRETVYAKKDSDIKSTRQMKEARFEHSIRQNAYEERQNQLRWQVKLGEDQISGKGRLDVMEARNEAWKNYRHKRGDPSIEEEQKRRKTGACFRRTIRDISVTGEEGVKFDLYANDMWAVRHATLQKFAQAARKVIIRARAEKNLKSLRQTLRNWEKKKFSIANLSADQQEKLLAEEHEAPEQVNMVLTSSKVKSITFPTYAAPNVKDDMAVDALGPVPYHPTEVIVRKKVPYFNLTVPMQSRLLGYAEHNTHNAAQNYISTKLARPLRTGAEDDIIKLPDDLLPVLPPAPSEVKVEFQNEGDVTLADMKDEETTVAVTLKAPEALFKPMEYPPLHIFNPTPGLQVFQAPLPYAEVDPDFHLCPLPRYISSDNSHQHTTTQKNYLDREDTIKGVMQWKKFASQGLTSLGSTPTLTNVWVPRWNDPYSEDLLPHHVPQLFDGLPVDDLEYIVDDSLEDENPVLLTPEMVNVQFASIDTHHDDTKTKNMEEIFPYGGKMPSTNIPVALTGPVAREQREQELDFFLNKKYNKFGTKVENRIKQLNSQKTSPDLILK